MEIERKFIVRELPDLNGIEPKNIIQGYISYNPEIRIRRVNNKAYITRKSNGTLVRDEVEKEIDIVTYFILTDIIKGRIINKSRYIYPLGNNLDAEIDIYSKDLNGLIIVETEFKTIEEAKDFVIPEWYGKEVTDDERYKNKNLALLNKEEINSLISKTTPLNLKLKKSDT